VEDAELGGFDLDLAERGVGGVGSREVDDEASSACALATEAIPRRRRA
jgi:hypothetical protein